MEVLRVGALSLVKTAVIQSQTEDDAQGREQALVAQVGVPALRCDREHPFQPAAGDERDIDRPIVLHASGEP